MEGSRSLKPVRFIMVDSIDQRAWAYDVAFNSLVDERGPFTVKLASRGNPDWNQDPRRPVLGVPTQVVRVASFEAASALCRLYIEHHELGGGNWTGGQIKRSSRVVAMVSYNGRVWISGKGAKLTAEAKLELPEHPACLAGMGCLCAGHARKGFPLVGRCDTTEIP